MAVVTRSFSVELQETIFSYLYAGEIVMLASTHRLDEDEPYIYAVSTDIHSSMHTFMEYTVEIHRSVYSIYGEDGRWTYLFQLREEYRRRGIFFPLEAELRTAEGDLELRSTEGGAFFRALEWSESESGDSYSS